MAVHAIPAISTLDSPQPGKCATIDGRGDEFGFGDVGLSQQDFELRENVVQLGYPPFRIDLLTDIDGVDFDAAWPNRETTIHDGLVFQFVGLSDLKANKRASGRPRDIDDLEQLP